MTYDVTTVKWFSVLLKASLSYLAKDNFFPSAHDSQNKPNISQVTVLGFFVSILIQNK